MLRGVSPLIVRTIEVPAAVTLAVLNRAMLVCFGWSGEHLHEFTVRAVGYSSDWPVDAHDSRNVTLHSLELRAGEGFWRAYDFFASWNVDVRVEAVPADTALRISCLSVRRARPTGMARRTRRLPCGQNAHSLSEYIECLLQLRAHVNKDGHRVDPFDLLQRFEALSLWVLGDRFDKADVNGRLPTLEVPSSVSSSKSG